MDKARTGRPSKINKVKNKAPAAIQVSAEQLLREAKERQEEAFHQPRQKIADSEELLEYRRGKRKYFEDLIRKNRLHVGSWLKYAQWEESQNEIDRARSVFERGLDMDSRSTVLWLKYAEMEIKQRSINHARNVLDRAVTILPRVDQLWYKYVYIEEKLGEVPKARMVFERWMAWEPNELAWQAYIKLEIRYGEIGRARDIYERYVMVHPEVKSWLKYAKFEEELGEPTKARTVYERAMQLLGDEYADEKLYISFAKFEIRCREFERARVIFQYALDHLPKHQAQELYKMYAQFEKQYGDRKEIEDVIVGKRRFQYEEEIKIDPYKYDTWFDYIRMEETNGDLERIRDVYERAIAQVPPAPEKRLWRRYIYLWINYALFEELDAQDIEKTRQVYQACIKVIPHKSFTFAKIWLLYANFEIRQNDLAAARKILGNAIGLCPKDKLFKGYIELELSLYELERCRILYGKFLEHNPANVYAWIKFTELEKGLGEEERVRAVFELAISQPLLDMPELLWKAYIDFEYNEGEYDNTRKLYERLLERTSHVKVWISFAEMEASIESEDQAIRARNVFKRAEEALKNKGIAEERVMLLDAWKQFEESYGDDQSKKEIMAKMPQKVARRRKVQTEDGLDAGWEEYIDYIFPTEQSDQPHLKLLAMAQQWKKKKVGEEIS